MSFSNGPTIVTNGLVLALDAGDRNSYVSGSTTWIDLAGTNNGTLTNGPTFSTGSDGSIVFDGVDDRCSIQNQNFNSTTSSSFTIEIMYKRNSSTPGSFSPLYFMGAGGTSDARIFFWFDDDNNGRMAINYYTRTGFDTYIELTRSLDTNFHYAVQVVDKNTLLTTGYFDGVNKGTGVIESSSTSDNTFKIGGNSSCNATIAFVRIYNRALTQTEVLQNYNATKGRFGL